MSSVYQRLTDNFSPVEYEGGKANLSYRHKCNFDQSKSGRYNKNRLQTYRGAKALLVLINIFINGWAISNNNKLMPGFYNLFMVTISFYSLWGAVIALFAHITSILACNYEGWFRTAYIANEISFAVNSVIMLIFWLLLWPLMNYLNMMPTAEAKWYQGLLHFIPWITTVAELAMTDIALEKSHWWIAYVVMCPCYMACNAWGALTWEPLKKAHAHGSVYGVEHWKTAPGWTVVIFIVMGFFQGGIYYCLCSIVERCWPKREAEMFEQGNALVNQGISLLNKATDQK